MVTVGIIFLVGLIVGSFLNVVIARYDDWRSIATGRSVCPKCRRALAWYDLIPVISFLTLRGRCRYCQKKIAWQYPFVELTYALLLVAGYNFVKGFYFFSLTYIWLEFVLYAIFVGVLIVIVFHDIAELAIPDQLSWILLAAGVAFSLLFYSQTSYTSAYWWQTVLLGALSASLPIALLVLVSRGKWMGEGDILLAAALGAFVGFPFSLVFLAVTFLIGGVIGAILLMLGKASRKTALPFAPLLAIGALLTFYYGSELIAWYLRGIGYV